MRVRGRNYSGYDTDTGLMTSRVYPPRYYRVPLPAPLPPPPRPIYPYYRQHELNRSVFHPDGYDTDSGLISSGRLHMTRLLPSRMAVIPETVVVNNRMVPSTNIKTVSANLPGSSFLNQTYRTGHPSGYETDSNMNVRQHHSEYRQIPADFQYGNSEWLRNQSVARTVSQQPKEVLDNNERHRQTQDQLRSVSIPVVSHHLEQQQKQV